MDSLEAAENESKRQNSGSSGHETAIGEKQPENDSGISSNGGEEVIYKHARKDSRENSLEENDLKDLATLTDEMLEKLDDNEKRRKDSVEEDNAGPEDKKDEEEVRKSRKKIDIANPDIINDFFKTDED